MYSEGRPLGDVWGGGVLVEDFFPTNLSQVYTYGIWNSGNIVTALEFIQAAKSYNYLDSGVKVNKSDNKNNAF